jgi:4a-hydroxytetrahydrobiopterin dehydratase
MKLQCDIHKSQCTACHGGVEPLRPPRAEQYLRELEPGWRIRFDRYLAREYLFNDFQEALSFVNKIGEVAEAQGHHPELHLSWGMVQVELWTHKIGGLHENDFILAAKIDGLYQNL